MIRPFRGRGKGRAPKAREASARNEGPLLFFDGDCALCSSLVAFILRHERDEAISFASLGGACGLSFLAARPELAGIDSLLWFEPRTGRVLWKSDACLRIAARLRWPWRAAVLAAALPRGLRDRIYDRLAAKRRLLAPRSVSCARAPAGLASRLPDGCG